VESIAHASMDRWVVGSRLEPAVEAHHSETVVLWLEWDTNVDRLGSVQNEDIEPGCSKDLAESCERRR